MCQGPSLKNGRSQSCGCLARELSRKRARNGNRRVDIAGRRFGMLVAIRPVGSKSNIGVQWLCRCDCGNNTIVPTNQLNSGNTRSCGCMRDSLISQVNKSHGKSHKSRLYNVWVGMRQRCNDKNHKSYHNYGGRGISVCDEWSDFSCFEKWSLENGYDETANYGDCTLDRIDVDGNYAPSNCRWADAKVQAANRRKHK